MSEPDWPDLPEELRGQPGSESHQQAALTLFQAQVAEVAARRTEARTWSTVQQERDRLAREALAASDDVLRDAVHAAYLDVTKTSLERLLKRADTIASAAAAAGTLYTATLALSFSVSDGTPLPAAGVVPAVFLALALLLVTVYSGFVRAGRQQFRAISSASTNAMRQQRLNTFVRWVNAIGMARTWAMRLAVVALALGILTLPLPFLAVDAWKVAVPAGLVLVVFAIVELVANHQGPERRSPASSSS